MDQLTKQSSKKRQVVSIVGMGGIGKTTLARKVYEDPSITFHFDKRSWVTVSEKYIVVQILRCLISCVIKSSSDELHEKRTDQDQLAESLYKRLKGQRYLIVIDDIWSKEAWDSVQRCFPDDNNGSRILLTSRLREVAEYADSGNSPRNKRFLDADESWNIYCKMFGKTEFHFVFEKIGRNIVKKCEGLPLAIIVVSSLLSKTKEEEERWKSIAENVSRFVIGDSCDAYSRILSLSYNLLPHHLKACFLYFGVFPEDYEIPVKKLVRLWAAEGFFRAVEHQNPEEVAMECLQDLVDRSLVLISKQSYNGKIKKIRIHDLLRDLCLREAQHENLLSIIGKPCGWISIRLEWFNNLTKSNKRFNKFHFLHCVDYFGIINFQAFSLFKLLRVVDMEIEFWSGGYNALNVLANLVHLRYLALSVGVVGYGDSFHVELFEHWNMQNFIVRGCGILDSSKASRIWKMSQLRNFYVEEILSLETSEVIHRNLESISWLGHACCTKDLFTRILNLKKLGIQVSYYHESPDYFYNLVHLGQFEKLSIRDLCLKHIPRTSFLPNLKKLNFLESSVPWSDLSLII